MRAYLLLLLLLASTGLLSAGPWQGFTALAVSPDGRWFVTGGREGELIWFETGTGEPRHRWVMDGEKPVVDLVFDKDSTHFAAVALDGSTAGASLSDERLEKLPPDAAVALGGAVAKWFAAPPVVSGVRTSQGDLWAQGGADGTITVGSVSLGRSLASWQAHDAAVTGLSFSADGSYLLSASYDGALRRWDSRTGEPRGSL